MTSKGSAIVIGSGLGGLECGYILARNGLKVTVLERQKHIGGCLQSFHRGEHLFDTGFHYVGALGEGQSLRRLFEYFGLMDLPWVQLDPECADEIVIDGRSFPFATGHDLFVERLSEAFPAERENLRRYAGFLKGVGDGIFKAFDGTQQMNELFGMGALDYLKETFSDPLLVKVLGGAFMRMQPQFLPLYEYAQISDSFMRSSWRLEGGGQQIADSLARSIESMGGEVRTRSEVTAIRVVDGKVSGVEVNGSEFLPAEWVVSDMHPAVTVELAGEDAFRKAYRNRILGLENTTGVFTANICLKPGKVEYLNRNIFIHRHGEDPWNPDFSGTGSVMVHFYPEKESGTASRLDLVCPMSCSSLEQWKDLPAKHRGEEYESLKSRKAEECLRLAAERVPGLEDAVDEVFTSTPLTYLSYNRSPEGSAFGVRKDYRNPVGTVLSPRTPVGNLLMTGQSLNLHGVLGVTMTSVLTCSEILGSPQSFLSLQ